MLVRCVAMADSAVGGGRGCSAQVYEGTHCQIPGALVRGREPPFPAQALDAPRRSVQHDRQKTYGSAGPAPCPPWGLADSVLMLLYF